MTRYSKSKKEKYTCKYIYTHTNVLRNVFILFLELIEGIWHACVHSCQWKTRTLSHGLAHMVNLWSSYTALRHNWVQLICCLLTQEDEPTKLRVNMKPWQVDNKLWQTDWLRKHPHYWCRLTMTHISRAEPRSRKFFAYIPLHSSPYICF